MKKTHRKYSEISSFDDFHSEKEKLKARGELAEAKLRLTQPVLFACQGGCFAEDLRPYKSLDKKSQEGAAL
jgi:hypothetical protein